MPLLFLLFSHPFWLNGTGPVEARDLGAAGARFHVPWAIYEPEPGVYDFTNSDIAANFYGLRDVEPLVILKCTPRIPDTSIAADTSGWNCCERQFWVLWHDSTEVVKELSWLPDDSLAWRNFVMTFVERYDGDGIDDFPGLVRPFSKYMTEAEYPRVWCRCTDDPVGDWISHINNTYAAVKAADSSAVSGMAGYSSPDVHFFYDGYIPVDSFLIKTTETGDIYVTREELSHIPDFLDVNANFHRIFTEASYDYYGLHLYGQAEYMPFRAEAMQDMFGDKPVISDEGGGPFRMRGEIFNPENDSGYISPELAAENAAYVIRYFVGGICSGFDALFWHVQPEYEAWGQVFGDLNLFSIDEERKPAYYVYRGLAHFIDTVEATSMTELADGIMVCTVTSDGSDLTFMWDIVDDESNIGLNLLPGSNIIRPPTVMGDSLWDSVYVSTALDTSLHVGRTPVLITGRWSFMSVDESPPETELHLNITSSPVRTGSTIDAGLEGEFELFDVSGRRVWTAFGSSMTWDDALPAGTYLIMHTSEKGRATAQIQFVK